jgi:hypothetical protein
MKKLDEIIPKLEKEAKERHQKLRDKFNNYPTLEKE